MLFSLNNNRTEMCSSASKERRSFRACQWKTAPDCCFVQQVMFPGEIGGKKENVERQQQQKK